MRQCIRVNFGQHKFLFPPDEIDKKPFRSIFYALLHKSDKTATKETSTKDVAGAGETTSGKEVSSKKFTNNPASSSATGASRAIRNIVDEVSRIMEQDPSNPNPSHRPIDALLNRGPPVAATSDSRAQADSPLPPSNAVTADGDDLEHHRSNNDGNSVVLDNADADNIRRYMAEGSYGADEDEDDEERDIEEDDEQQYMLEQRWHADLEARMRMEAEEDQEDFEFEREHESYDEEEEEEEEEEVDTNMYRAQGEAGVDEVEEEEEEDTRARAAAILSSAHASNSAHMVELRRQAMVESLIGMGFPVDWALRAAEHCDSASSESAAISWIIERMEMEQSNINELEQDSSR
ncbi:hypothetical protein EON65_15260 [archaeon]|nr:MAG: hypothetical protein EON65_15260 [archaeon]